MTCSAMNAGKGCCEKCGQEVKASFIMCHRGKRTTPMSAEDQAKTRDALQATAMSMHLQYECPKREGINAKT